MIEKTRSLGEKTPAKSTFTDADSIWSTIKKILPELSDF